MNSETNNNSGINFYPLEYRRQIKKGLQMLLINSVLLWPGKLRSYIDNKKNQKNILKYHKQLFTA